MKITKISPRTGKENTLDLPVTRQQIDDWKNSRFLIQDAFPDLTPGQREFLMTGYTEEDWEILFPPEEDQ
jgi:hypothetical protein